MKNLQCKLTRKRWLEIGVSALLFVLIIAWALVLEYTEPDREATAARKRYFAVARVTDILDDNAETQDWTEGRRIGQQYLEVEILNGPWKGETLEAINYLTSTRRSAQRSSSALIWTTRARRISYPFRIITAPRFCSACLPYLPRCSC